MIVHVKLFDELNLNTQGRYTKMAFITRKAK